MKGVLIGLGLLSAPAGAFQYEIHSIHNPACCSGSFAAAVDGGHDVDGDGIGDMLVGGPDVSVDFVRVGRAWVYSGFDGSEIHVFDGEAGGDDFGATVSFVDDLDGDLVSDLIVGAPLHDTGAVNAGRVYVFSGATGDPIATLDGGLVQQFFGRSVAGVADLDGDGAGEVLVGAPGPGSGDGSAGLYSGADLTAGMGAGALITGLVPVNDAGAECCLGFGASVAFLGDVDADGTGDYGVGAPQDGDGTTAALGAGYVYSGATHAPLGIFHGASAWNRFGSSMAGDCDVNADGYDDVLIGALRCVGGDNDVPYVRVLSGAAMAGAGGPSVLYTLSVPGIGNCTEFGASMDGIGDVDCDGAWDIAVGAPGDDTSATNAGSVWFFSGRTGQYLFRVLGEPAAEGFGRAVSRAGDLNLDRMPDYLVGAPAATPNGGELRARSVFPLRNIRPAKNPPLDAGSRTIP